MHVLGHVNERDHPKRERAHGLVNRFGKPATPRIVRQQRQAAIAGKRQLVTVPRLMIVPNGLVLAVMRYARKLICRSRDCKPLELWQQVDCKAAAPCADNAEHWQDASATRRRCLAVNRTAIPRRRRQRTSIRARDSRRKKGTSRPGNRTGRQAVCCVVATMRRQGHPRRARRIRRQACAGLFGSWWRRNETPP
jgi:hypothetical protein